MELHNSPPYLQTILLDNYVYHSLQPDLPYAQEKEIESGSYSTVFLSTNFKRKPCAVKSNLVGQNNFEEYFRELLVKRLDKNPYCMTPENVYWSRMEDKVELGLSYEFYDGDLIKWFDKNTSARKMIRFCLDHYDHFFQMIYFLIDNGFFHYDIKPDNILYRYRGNKIDLKLSDFGIISLTPCWEDSTKNFRRWRRKGTKQYLAVSSPYYDYVSMFEAMARTLLTFFVPTERLEKVNKKFTWKEVMAGTRIKLSSEDEIKIKTLISLANGDRDIDSFPPRLGNYQKQSNKKYSTWKEIGKKIGSYYPHPDIDNVPSFLALTWSQVTAIRVGKNKRLGLLEFVRVVDCVSRYLKVYPFSQELVPNLVLLIAEEVKSVQHWEECRQPNYKFQPADLIDLLIKLDFNIGDCDVGELTFCLKDRPKIDINPLIQSPSKIFKSPFQVVTEYLRTTYPEIESSCDDSLGYENILIPSREYKKVPDDCPFD